MIRRTGGLLRSGAKAHVRDELARLAQLQSDLVEARHRYEEAIAELDHKTEAAIQAARSLGASSNVERLPRFPESAFDRVEQESV